MAGLPRFNFPAFHQAAYVLREKGFQVFNPAEHECYTGEHKGYAFYMQRDLPEVCKADLVVVLPGWENSKGANLEVHVAHECGIPVVKYPSFDIILPHNQPAETTHSQEQRVTCEATGGQKGRKQADFSLLPWDVLEEDAKLYATGAQKYESRNWERGYAWGLSFAAAIRHLTAFWQKRESLDPETQQHHLACARFHLAALMRFEQTNPELDDRPQRKAA